MKNILSIAFILVAFAAKGQIQEYVIEASDSLITRGVLQIDADKFKATTQVSSDDTTLVSLDYLTNLLDNAEYADSLAFHSGTGYLVYYRQGVALDSTSLDGRYQTILTNPVTGTGTTNYLPKFTGLSTLGNSLIYDNGANVGIGTNSPTRLLTLSASSPFLGLYSTNNIYSVLAFGDPQDDNISQIIYDHTVDKLSIQTGGGGTLGGTRDKLVIDNDGLVGIYTLTPTQRLDVNGNARFRSIGTTTTSTVLGVTSDGTLTTNVSITGGATWKGGWNASTNTPTLSDATGTNGWWYKVTVAGTQNLGSGSVSYAVGDDVIHNGTVWQKFSASINESDPVFVASDVYEWTEQDSIDWSTAYSWGDHSTEGYNQNLSLGTVTTTTQPINISNGTGITLPSATTSTAGLMSSADKTNLNTVVGYGNFRDYGLGRTTLLGYTGGDVNDIAVASGLYSTIAFNTLNTPLFSSSGALVHLQGGASGNNYMGQLWLRTGTNTVNELWVRSSRGTTWNTWNKIYHDGNFTDNSTNWNTAYNDKINSAAFSGTTTKTLTMTQQDGGTVTANFTDNNTTSLPVKNSAGTTQFTADQSTGVRFVGSGATLVSFTPATQLVTISSTDNNTTYSAGTGLSLSGTTFNHSNSVTASNFGPTANATLSFGGTFTVPYATYDAQGHITGRTNRTLTMPANPNTDSQNLSLGTVTATTQPIGISGGTGVTLPAATTTTAGLMSATDKTNLNTAYNDKINSAAFSGTTTKTLTLTQQDGGTVTANFTDDNTTYTAGTGISASGTTFNLGLEELTTGAPSLNTHFLPWVNSANNLHYRVGLLDLQEISGWDAGKLQNVAISSTAPTTNYVLKYNGTTWAPAPDATGASYWTQASGALYPATIGDEVRIGSVTDLGAQKLQVDASSVFRLRNVNTSQPIDFITTGTGTQPYFRFEHDGSGGLRLASYDGSSSWNEVFKVTAASRTPQFPAGLILGTSFSTSTAGSIRWNGTNFQGYNGSTWVNLDTQGGTGGMTDPMTTRGDIIYRNSSNVTARLGRGTAGQLLYSNGTDLSWRTPVKADIGLGNVENTALSTWTGSTNLSTVGSITQGNWNADPISVTKGGTGKTSYTAYALLAGGSTSTGTLQQVAGVGTSGQVLTSNGAGALPTWQAAPSGTAALTNTYVGVGNSSNQLSGTNRLTFLSSSDKLTLGEGEGWLNTGFIEMKANYNSTITPTTNRLIVFAKNDNVIYTTNDEGFEMPIHSSQDNNFVVSAPAGGFTLSPVDSLGNGMYMYELTISIMNRAGTIINAYKKHFSFRFASGSISFQSLYDVNTAESNPAVTIDAIQIRDLGSYCRLDVDFEYSIAISNTHFTVDAKRIAYKSE